MNDKRIKIQRSNPESFDLYDLIVIGNSAYMPEPDPRNSSITHMYVPDIGYVMQNDVTNKKLVILRTCMVDTISYEHEAGFYNVMHSHDNRVIECIKHKCNMWIEGNNDQRTFKAALITLKLLDGQKLSEYEFEVLKENSIHRLDGKEFT